MPFKSKAQRRLFYAMKNRGEMSQKTIDHWEESTPNKIPEKVPHKKESSFYERGKIAVLRLFGLVSR